VFTIPIIGGMPKLLLRDAYSAVWSPDGTRLAFSSIRDQNGIDCNEETCAWSPELYVSAADGRGARRLTSNEGSDGSPTWSLDGSRILFSSDQNMPDGEASEIYSVAPDGSCLTWITNGTPGSAQPSFRPGSGDTFDPGSCNPADHPLRPELPTPKPFAGGLWLGPRFGGLLASDTAIEGEVRYVDCEHYDARRCPTPVKLTTEPACSMASWRLLLEFRFTFTRRRGAVLAYYDRGADGQVLSGDGITSIELEHPQNTLRRVRWVFDGLRPYEATSLTRLAAPRVPRALARRFDRTARVVNQLGRAGAAKRLKLRRTTVGAHLRLRAVLRPYQLCDGRSSAR
jgi:hypothetical protein